MKIIFMGGTKTDKLLKKFIGNIFIKICPVLGSGI